MNKLFNAVRGEWGAVLGEGLGGTGASGRGHRLRHTDRAQGVCGVRRWSLVIVNVYSSFVGAGGGQAGRDGLGSKAQGFYFTENLRAPGRQARAPAGH